MNILKVALLAAAAMTATTPAPARVKILPSHSPSQFRASVSGGVLEVTALDDDIFRVTVIPPGREGQMPVSQSAVYKGTGDTRLNTVVRRDGNIDITTPTTRLCIEGTDGRISFYDAKGGLLAREKEGVQNHSRVRRISFEAPAPGEYLYGAGERGHSLALNGDSLPMYNRQNYGYTGSDPRIRQMGITVPWVTSSLGYGILFDDFSKSDLVIGDDALEYTAPMAVGPLSYYFVNGHGTLAGTASGYATLTGHQELPPFWALGYITSKYGYRTQAETLGVVDTLKTRGYPVDGVVLDLYWYGQETDMGRLQWDTVQWPDHRAMIADLRDQGVNLVAITQPYINKIGAIDNYNYLTGRGMTVRDWEGANHDVTTWVGDAGMFDLSNPDTRAWYWDRYKTLTDDGMAGWWGDLGEPEVHPASIRHHNGLTAEQYHNVYGNEWSRLIWEGWKENYPDRRPLLLMRGGTAGLQRYSVFPWSTDVSRSWGGLEPQVRIMLNSGLSGLGYMSSDIGGFAVDPEHPTDPELYVRWLQMGAFTPTLRTHAQQKPEPYHYPQYEPILKKYIAERYRWLPYNYTLAWVNASQGLPLARPLNFRGGSEKTADVGDEYLWGDEVLVAPVLEKGARSRSVTFPEGSGWVDYDNPGPLYKGGSTAKVSAPLDRLPLFVREGSFIPLYDRPIANVTEYDLSDLTVRYYPSAAPSEYTLFDDDRLSPSSLQDGRYLLTRFTGVKENGKILIGIETSADPAMHDWMPDVRNLRLQVMQLHRSPRSVTLTRAGGSVTVLQSGKGWSWNPLSKILTVDIPFDGKLTEITIE